MGLYFGETEITKLRNLVPQTGLDITGLWFGETNVFTVWKVHEGTLPATLNANGADMRQYQVWGNAGGVGDRTDNKFDYQKYFETCTQFNSYFDYAPLQLKPNTQYTVYTNCLSGTSGSQAQNIETSVIICPAEVTFNTANGGVYGNTPFTLTTQASGLCNIGIRTEHGAYASFTGIYEEPDFASSAAYINIVEGAAVSETYVPYGYKLDMSVSDGTNTTTVPIYIGSDPLDEDEYMDYQAQKVYRMIDGILTPTDPHVPLPAFPTCEGATIVDYAGQSVAPEKVFLKYRKEGY